MARTCDGCTRLIEQQDDEYLELQVRVLDATESAEQDEKAQRYGDFCDACIGNGTALSWLLKEVNWNLDRPDSSMGRVNAPQSPTTEGRPDGVVGGSSPPPVSTKAADT